MIRLFCGYDKREAIGSHLFAFSVVRRASVPVAITMLDSKGLPVGSNDFTFSRFLVPWLCDFDGHAIFMDGADMIMQADIAALNALFDPQFAVQVVRHKSYSTQHKIKYRGTSMQCPNRDYARKNWASVMLVNCAHPHWSTLTPETLQAKASSGLSLLQFEGLRLDADEQGRSEVGALPEEWNRMVDEGQQVDGAKVLHWTAGIPGFHHYREAPGAEAWFAERDNMMVLA